MLSFAETQGPRMCKRIYDMWLFLVLVLLHVVLQYYVEMKLILQLPLIQVPPSGRAENFINSFQYIRAINYLLIPVVLIIRYGFHAAVIQTGLLLQRAAIKLSRVFQQVVVAGIYTFAGDVIFILSLSTKR